LITPLDKEEVAVFNSLTPAVGLDVVGAVALEGFEEHAKSAAPSPRRMNVISLSMAF